MGELEPLGSFSSGYGYGGGYDKTKFAVDEECCPAVVDPITLLSLLGGIALGALIFAQLIQDNVLPTKLGGRRKRRGLKETVHMTFEKGRQPSSKIDQNLGYVMSRLKMM